VNYNEVKWDTFTRITETPGQFAFYNGKSIALVIRKSRFNDRLELLKAAAGDSRHVANNELFSVVPCTGMYYPLCCSAIRRKPGPFAWTAICPQFA
jgi:hypothetical protein